MSRRRFDPVTLAFGVTVLAFGGLLFSDQEELIHLSPGWFLAALAAAVGIVLLVGGLAARER